MLYGSFTTPVPGSGIRKGIFSIKLIFNQSEEEPAATGGIQSTRPPKPRTYMVKAGESTRKQSAFTHKQLMPNKLHTSVKA